MARIRYTHNTFSVGVISTKVKGNTDFEGYNNALDSCVNFQVQQTGGLFKRGGTHFVATTKNGKEARLIMFSYDADSQYILEFGERYIRFFSKDGPILNRNGEVLEIETKIPMKEVKKMHTFQDGNQLILVTTLGIWALTRTSSTSFSLSEEIDYTCEPLTFVNREKIAFKPSKTTGTKDDPLTITVVDPLDPKEPPSSKFQPVIHEEDEGHEICLTYSIENPLSGVWEDQRFYLRIISVYEDSKYPVFNCCKAYIETEKSYQERSELPTNAPVVKWQIGAFNSARGMPLAAALFEGRLFLANNTDNPSGIWGSAKLYHDWTDFYLGILDTDGVQFRMHAEHADAILWMVGQAKLFIGTKWGIFLAGSASFNDEAITPSNFRIRLFASVGASPLQPISALDSVFFVDSSNRNVHEIRLYSDTGTYQAQDISLLASDLTQSGIIAHTWQQTPVKTYWCAVNDGFLCSLTYLKENGIMAWTKHVISGKNVKVEDLCSMHGNKNDLLWMIVRREINGQFVRYIEYMHPPYEPLEQEEFKQFYVDSGIAKGDPLKISSVTRGNNPVFSISNPLNLTKFKNGDGIISAILFDISKKDTIDESFSYPFAIKPILDNEACSQYKAWRAYAYKEQTYDKKFVPVEAFCKLNMFEDPTNLDLYIKVCSVSDIFINKYNHIFLTCNNISELSDNEEVILEGFTELPVESKLPITSVLLPEYSYYLKDLNQDCNIDFCRSKKRISYKIRKVKDQIQLYTIDGHRAKVAIVNNDPKSNHTNNPAIYKKLSKVVSLDKRLSFASVTLNHDVDISLYERQSVYINHVSGMKELQGEFYVRKHIDESLILFEHTAMYKYLDNEDFSPFDDVNPSGNMYFYFDQITAKHLVGQKVAIVSNGNSAGYCVVPSDGVIKIRPTPYCVVGLPMSAHFRTTSFSGGSLIGSSVGTVGSQQNIWMYLYYSLGGNYGADPDKLFPIPYQKFISGFDKPKSLTTGLVKCPMINSKDVYNRSVFIQHDEPLSFNVLSITQDMEVSDA